VPVRRTYWRQAASPEVADPHTRWRHLQRSILLLVLVTAVGTFGYWVLGLNPLDALYQTVTTISTVGFRELGESTSAWKLFTIAIVLAGVGIALYTLGVLLETLIEGRLSDQLWRRRLERQIASLHDHVIVCGWGRVGCAIAAHLSAAGREVVVVDLNPERLVGIEHPAVNGDATDDSVLREAGIERASALIAALDTDADNLYVTLSGRALRPEILIVARARVDSAERKLLQAGANRVVNPQQIGGARMAALAIHPVVADFLEVVMHDGNVEFRLAEVAVPPGSELAGTTLRDSHLRDRTGTLVLAVRRPTGEFTLNPEPETRIAAADVLVVIGTQSQIEALVDLAVAAVTLRARQLKRRGGEGSASDEPPPPSAKERSDIERGQR
jgi:voltage-gated potassium channel